MMSQFHWTLEYNLIVDNTEHYNSKPNQKRTQYYTSGWSYTPEKCQSANLSALPLMRVQM